MVKELLFGAGGRAGNKNCSRPGTFLDSQVQFAKIFVSTPHPAWNFILAKVLCSYGSTLFFSLGRGKRVLSIEMIVSG